jgi:uncharacterized protein YoxC
MIYILIAIIVVLCFAIVCISVEYMRQKRRYQQSSDELKSAIVQLTHNVKNRERETEASFDKLKTFYAAGEKIQEDLGSFRNETLKILTDNNLLK